MTRWSLLAAAGIAFSTAGCGTFANTCWLHREEGGMRVFGGVRADCEVFRESISAPSHDSCDHACAWRVLVDMPFSAVADTATLPVTVPVSLWWMFHPLETTREGRGQAEKAADSGIALPPRGPASPEPPARLPGQPDQRQDAADCGAGGS